MKFLAAIAAFALAGAWSSAAEDSSEQLFVRRIAPLLAEKCAACHGKEEAKIKGGLDLRTHAAAMKGGDCGKPALVAGKPDESPLFLAATRPPNADELQTCLAHWRKIETTLPPAPPAQKPPLEIRREAVEENTGEKFTFTERLHANADFIPDLQPADCDAHTRALADVCLVLFNSNEFAYVY